MVLKTEWFLQNTLGFLVFWWTAYMMNNYDAFGFMQSLWRVKLKIKKKWTLAYLENLCRELLCICESTLNHTNLYVVSRLLTPNWLCSTLNKSNKLSFFHQTLILIREKMIMILKIIQKLPTENIFELLPLSHYLQQFPYTKPN